MYFVFNRHECQSKLMIRQSLHIPAGRNRASTGNTFESKKKKRRRKKKKKKTATSNCSIKSNMSERLENFVQNHRMSLSTISPVIGATLLVLCSSFPTSTFVTLYIHASLLHLIHMYKQNRDTNLVKKPHPQTETMFTILRN